MLIKEIPNDERPRERLLKYGVNNLSNEDLLSIIIKNGTKGYSVRDLSLSILKKIGGIEKLKDINLHTLDDIKGLGNVKKMEILSCIELGKRIYLKNNFVRQKFIHPREIYQNNLYLFKGLKQECFYVFYLDCKKYLIERKLLFMGTINRSIIHPREVFKHAYLCSASSIICMHNHPSGDVIPSNADIEITKTLLEIGRIQGIDLIDHIVVSDLNYFSFYENNILE